MSRCFHSTAALALMWACGAALHAAPAIGPGPTREQIAQLYRPFQKVSATLSPDGHHLVLLMYKGGSQMITVLDVGRPDTPVFIAPGGTPPALVAGIRRAPTRVNFVDWVSSDRLIYEGLVPGTGSAASRNEVHTVAIDGSDDKMLYNADDIKWWQPPGAIRLVGLVPDLPNTVAIQRYGGDWIEPIHLNFVTGAYRSLGYKEFGEHAQGANEPQKRLLEDRQGRVRLLETKAILLRKTSPKGPPDEVIFPQDLLYQPVANGLLQGDSALDRLFHSYGGVDWRKFVGLKTGELAFNVVPEDYYGHRSFPLAFGADPNLLYYASNIGQDTYGIYALDLNTRKRTDLAVDDPVYDLVQPDGMFSSSSLVFDRHDRLAGVRDGPGTKWLDPAMARLQADVDRISRALKVKILEWNDALDCVLAVVSGPDQPGSYCIIVKGQHGRLIELEPRAPWLPPETPGISTPFAFDTPEGVHLTGMLTMPRVPRTSPPPLVLYCRDVPGPWEEPEFDPDLQAIAAMGFAAARVDYRGSAGLGAKHREAIKGGYDSVPVADLLATLKWISSHEKIDLKRVALLGDDFGGFVALRALEMHPEVFRCAISIDAPTDLAGWALHQDAITKGYEKQKVLMNLDVEHRRAFFDSSPGDLTKASVISHADNLTEPVFIIQDPDKQDLYDEQGTSLRNRLRSINPGMRFLEVPGIRNASVRADTMLKIGEFLTESFYTFDVQIGPLRVLK